MKGEPLPDFPTALTRRAVYRDSAEVYSVREGVSGDVGCLYAAGISENRVAVRAVRVMCASWLPLFPCVPRFAE